MNQEEVSREELSRQYEDIAKTIRNLMGILTSLCLFCIMTLGAPDVNLVTTDAKIKIPLANTDVSYAGFLLFGPLILIGLTFYLHLHIEQFYQIKTRLKTDTGSLVMNVENLGARIFSGFVFYGMTPAVLVFFTVKALPRTEVTVLGMMTTIVTTALIWLKIKRDSRQTTKSCWRWIVRSIFSILAVIFLLQFLVFAFSSVKQAQSSDSSFQRKLARLRALLYPARTLDLYMADLPHKNLSSMNFLQADLRRATLTKSVLEHANLSNADLSKADLTETDLSWANLRGTNLIGANLTDARLFRTDLRGAVIDENTQLSDKWLLVWELVSQPKKSRMLIFADLSGADLRDVDFSEEDLGGADLRGADLRGAKFEGTKLDGVLFDDNVLLDQDQIQRFESVSKKTQYPVTAFYNSIAGKCISANRENIGNGVNPLMSACEQNTFNYHWMIERLPNGAVIISDVTGKFCLDSTYNKVMGTKPHLWTCIRNHANQHWAIRRIHSGELIFTSQSNNLCLDSGGEHAENLYLGICEPDNLYQRWLLNTY